MPVRFKVTGSWPGYGKARQLQGEGVEVEMWKLLSLPSYGLLGTWDRSSWQAHEPLPMLCPGDQQPLDPVARKRTDKGHSLSLH